MKMSVFEDLIGELKSENLLEDTVIDLGPADAAAAQTKPAEGKKEVGLSGEVQPPVDSASAGDVDDLLEVDIPNIEKPATEKEFFRKRAMDEVSSLQMVEHVLSGIEREHLKITPVPFDDLNAKKALHKFMQISGDVKTPEHAEAELALRQETEAWSYALYERDQKISVANVRRFCEECRPALSSQALIALARFYRNSPFSEDVRGKFDYVMTKLFSRVTEDEERKLLFGHAEMIGHVNTLYANWSSIALYTQEDDQVEVSLSVLRFEEFAIEADAAETFDELLETDFFNRVRVYKEEAAEMFYVPEVVAAAITCNLTIGNRYVKLIAKERRHGVEKVANMVEAKYGSVDQTVSSAAARTLILTDVLESDIGFDEAIPEETRSAPKTVPTAKAKKPAISAYSDSDKGSFLDNLLGANKWLMAACVAFILCGAGVYIWAERSAADDGTTSSVPTASPLKIEDAEINKFIRSPRSTKETLYAIVEPAFDSLSTDQKKELLGKIQQFAASKNLKKVSLIDKTGKAVAYASPERFELVGVQ